MVISIEAKKETELHLGSLNAISTAAPAAPTTQGVELIRPGDPGYETHRKAWNSLFDRRPALITRPRSAEEVAEAVRLARREGLAIAVRSGGHSVAGHSTTEGGLLIDLSRMKGLTIDPEKRVAVAEPGLTWGEYSGQAARYGLATPAGDASSVGVGGLTLGGGIGWLARKYGMTIDHLVSAQVVTAQGEILTASEREHPDLFWAIRGGGGNFGIVTRFEFRLVPVPQILAGGFIYPAEPEIVAAYARVALEAPEELTTISNLMRTPPIPFLSPDLYGKVHFHIIFCYAGDPEEGQRAIAPLASLGPLLGQMVAPMPYPGIYGFTEEATVSHAASVRNHFLNGVDEEVASSLVESMKDATSPMSVVQIRPLGGQMARVAPEATAFAHRNRPVLVAGINPWDQAPGESSAPHIGWSERLWEQLRPHSAGAYVGFVGDEKSTGDPGEGTYPAATYSRLAEVKAKYDPENLFRANHNITPRNK